jgi:hypothetical protein
MSSHAASHHPTAAKRRDPKTDGQHGAAILFLQASESEPVGRISMHLVACLGLHDLAKLLRCGGVSTAKLRHSSAALRARTALASIFLASSRVTASLSRSPLAPSGPSTARRLQVLARGSPCQSSMTPMAPVGARGQGPIWYRLPAPATPSSGLASPLLPTSWDSISPA